MRTLTKEQTRRRRELEYQLGRADQAADNHAANRISKDICRIDYGKHADQKETIDLPDDMDLGEINLLGGFVLVEKQSLDVSKMKIIIPEKFRKKYAADTFDILKGIVISKGWTECAKSDTVLFNYRHGTDVNNCGKRYLIINEADIIARII